MPRKDPTADAISKIAGLRLIHDSSVLTPELKKLLASKSSYVVSRAADLCGERTISALMPELIERLKRLFDDPKSDDVGCAAAMAIVQALIKLGAGYEAEDVALRAARHVRWESVLGGSVDVAVSLRGNAAILLAAMGSTDALPVATELLAEPDIGPLPPRERVSWPARADAARALTMIGSDGAAAVLRFKLLIGDTEPTVLSDCLAGLLTIERDRAIPTAEQMLTSPHTVVSEAAILAIGAWRDPRAFQLLQKQADRFLCSESRELLLASIAMTRRPEAIDYLIDLARSPTTKRDALKALEPLKLLPGVAKRIESL